MIIFAYVVLDFGTGLCLCLLLYVLSLLGGVC